jgi:hypothetical protein
VGDVAARVEAPDWTCTNGGRGTTPPVAGAPPSPSRGGKEEFPTLKMAASPHVALYGLVTYRSAVAQYQSTKCITSASASSE